MSRRKKMPEKVSSKTSILSYFSPSTTKESPSKRFQKTTLKTSNQNNNNNKATKRKLGEKISSKSSPRKKKKIVNFVPIVISSDESGEDENLDFVRRKRKKKIAVTPIKTETEQKFKISTSGKISATANDFLEDDNNFQNTDQKSYHENTNVTAEQNIPDFKYDLRATVSNCNVENSATNDGDFDQPSTSQSEQKLTDSHSPNDQNLDQKTEEILDNSAPKEPVSNGLLDGTIPDTSSSDDQNLDEKGKIAYYLLNFRQILDTVLENDDDRALFEGTDDITWINKFNEMPLEAQKLYVRLYHRKVAWLRLEQVNYPDISKNINRVLKKLSEEGFLLCFDQHNTNDLELKDILKLLPAPSLKDIAKSFKINVNGRQKNQITEELCKMCKKQKSVISGFFAKKSPGKHQKIGLSNNVLKRACKALGPCYKVAPYPRTVFNRVLLVFDVTRGIDDETECTLTGSQNSMGQGRHLQLSAILMAGMGKVSYPSCDVHRPTPIFNRRADLLHYETAFQFQADVLACVEAGQWEDAAAICESANFVRVDIETNDHDSCEHTNKLPEFLRCFTAHWTYKRLRSLEVEILQRLKNYRKAVDILQELLDQRIYCTSRRGHWWERLALNIDQHLKDPVRSLDVIHESLQDEEVRVGHKLALAQRVSKILTSRSVKKLPQLTTTYKTKLKPVIDRLKIEEAPVVEISGRLLPSDVQTGKSRFIGTEHGDGDSESESTFLCSVEELALSHYKNLGYDHGIHGEGGTFSTLFCLFLWDIIFMPGIPDVFRTTYQTHPLDFHTDGFYQRRQEVIEKRLKLVENLKDEDFVFVDQEEENEDGQSSAVDIMSITWDIEYGKACAGMNWERFTSLEEAKGFVKCIGGKVLSGIFRRLAKYLRHTRSGLPDLVVWNPMEKIYKMVEVKGPGDRLSTNQKLWIDELIRLDANIEVCKVIAIGGKKLTRD